MNTLFGTEHIDEMENYLTTMRDKAKDDVKKKIEQLKAMEIKDDAQSEYECENLIRDLHASQKVNELLSRIISAKHCNESSDDCYTSLLLYMRTD